jgi:hypothetical protein
VGEKSMKNGDFTRAGILGVKYVIDSAPGLPTPEFKPKISEASEWEELRISMTSNLRRLG